MIARITPPTYRPDIDGLRAIAILGVLFFHAGLGFPGGYVGVDVFFVISGFLITTLLIRDFRNGSFSFLSFWERRIRRIVPALAVLVAAVILAGWRFLLPSDYEVLGKQIIALLLCASNVKFWWETGYFSPAAHEKPLLHTWSLSVEEQFYLIIPAVLALLFWLRKSSWVVPMLLVGGTASLGLSIYGSYSAPAATFYLLPSRAWELAAGALLVFTPAPRFEWQATIAAAFGMLGILLAYLFYSPATRFPGLWTLPPVLGSAAVIWAGMGSAAKISWPTRLLGTPCLVWVGLLSYSLYLWHWPIFAFQKYLGYSTESKLVQFSLAAAAFLPAWISLHFVERPFRRRTPSQTRGRVFGVATIATVVLFGFSLLLVGTNGFKDRLTPLEQTLATGAADYSFIKDLDSDDVPAGLHAFGNKDGSPKVLLWGDSHAVAVLPVLDVICSERGVAGQAATSSATVPVLNWWYAGQGYGLNEKAPAFNRKVVQYVVDQARGGNMMTVVIAARWEMYLERLEERQAFRDALEATVRVLLAERIPVVLLKEVPKFDFEPPKALVLASLGFGPAQPLYTDISSHYDRTLHQNAVFSRLALLELQIVDPALYFTDTSGLIHPADAEGPLWADSNHLSGYGSLRLKQILSEKIK